MGDDPYKYESDYERIRLMVERDLRADKERRGRFLFRLNVALYVFFLLFVWVRLFPILDGFWDEWWVLSLVAMSAAGFVQVLIHWVVYRLNSSQGERALRDRLLGGAIRSVMDTEDSATDKPKRVSHLTEDGELADNHENWPRETETRWEIKS